MLNMRKRIFVLTICFALIFPSGVLSASAESNICTVVDNTEQLSTTINNEGLMVFGFFGGKSSIDHGSCVATKNQIARAV